MSGIAGDSQKSVRKLLFSNSRIGPASLQPADEHHWRAEMAGFSADIRSGESRQFPGPVLERSGTGNRVFPVSGDGDFASRFGDIVPF